ncbi:hypothetical protein N3Z17_02315 [Candidatus Bandiella numerosa]|uniref:hypothetical protein n=1 Tax=Candidatus Bandiella numerosa TaxID=2570586 RepID=UPI00249E4A9D|nr:hypothetical protein [Candidatus Bandiella numerosa]WHA05364.1 hypothetical protein N3Z17_02315 [Candidatus Bandiella numerosa]
MTLLVMKVDIISIVKEIFAKIGDAREVNIGLKLAQRLAKTQANENEQAEPEIKKKTKIRKFFDKFLDFITSPGVGTILTVFGAITILSSPLGIAVGATIAAVTMVSYSIARIRATLRMRTIKRTQQKDLLLDSLDQKIEKTLEKSVNPKLREMANQEIMSILKKSISDEPANKDKKLVNIISSKIRYFGLTGVANWVLSILSLNPASIALSSTSLMLVNGSSYFGEADYRKNKDLLDSEVSEKEGKLIQYLKKELRIEDKYIDKLSNQDLLKILSIKEAEISCGRKKYESDEEMQKALKVETKKCEDVNLTGYKPEVGFVQDFGNLFLNSFSSQQHGKFFAPLSHRENVEKTTQDDELQNLNAFKKDKLLQMDGKGKDIEMTEINHHHIEPIVIPQHHSVKDIIKEEGDKLKKHSGTHQQSVSDIIKGDSDKGASIEMTEINRKHDKTFVVTEEHHFREDIIHERDTKNGEKTIAK